MPCRYIQAASDLVTSKQTTREGFTVQAQKKTEKASLYLDKANAFWASLKDVEMDDLGNEQGLLKLINDETQRDNLLAAAGFSSKAIKHFKDDKEALNRALKKVFELVFQRTSVEDERRHEILNRYLLTKGDALGGQMRNLTGVLAQRKLTEAINDVLVASDGEAKVKEEIRKSEGDSSENPAEEKEECDDGSKEASEFQEGKPEKEITEISWKDRRLYLNRKVSFIKKNIDLILIDVSAEQDLFEGYGSKKSKKTGIFPKKTIKKVETELLNDPNNYLACGELKGGIDPAGADEHWKTANKAFDRIRAAFREQVKDCPPLFFIGVAIVDDMATEIFNDLQNNRLTYAANLNNDAQVKDLASWLVNL
jgi:hypothetical protein